MRPARSVATTACCTASSRSARSRPFAEEFAPLPAAAPGSSPSRSGFVTGTNVGLRAPLVNVLDQNLLYFEKLELVDEIALGLAAGRMRTEREIAREPEPN